MPLTEVVNSMQMSTEFCGTYTCFGQAVSPIMRVILYFELQSVNQNFIFVDDCSIAELLFQLFTELCFIKFFEKSPPEALVIKEYGYLPRAQDAAFSVNRSVANMILVSTSHYFILFQELKSSCSNSLFSGQNCVNNTDDETDVCACTAIFSDVEEGSAVDREGYCRPTMLQ